MRAHYGKPINWSEELQTLKNFYDNLGYISLGSGFATTAVGMACMKIEEPKYAAFGIVVSLVGIGVTILSGSKLHEDSKNLENRV